MKDRKPDEFNNITADGRSSVTRLTKTPRQDWGRAFQHLAEQCVEELWEYDLTVLSKWDEEEWEW